MCMTTQLELEQRYVYESPDGGKTVYRRKIGGTNDVTRERVTPVSYTHLTLPTKA